MFTHRDELEKELRTWSSKVRVGFPGDEAYHLVTVGPQEAGYGGVGKGVGNTQRDGAIVIFIDQLLTTYGLSWYEVTISDDSHAFSPASSYTACIHDIALNRTDVCVGPFWTPAFRRKLVAFTGDLFSAQFALVVRQLPATQRTFAEMVASPFEPFEAEVWAYLVLTLFYVGLIRWAIQPNGDGRNIEVVMRSVAKTVDTSYRRNAKGRGGGGQCGDSARSVAAADATLRDRTWRAFKELLFNQGVAFQGFLGDWRGDDPSALSQWINLLGASFAMLVVITFYTAQVTRSLIFSSSVRAVSSLEGAVAGRMPICALESMRTAFEAQYTDVAKYRLYVPVSDQMEVLTGMDSGLCDVGVLTKEMWDFVGRSDPRQCATKSQ